MEPHDLEAALSDALPGVQIVDRDLQLGSAQVDWVGVDADGGLVLFSSPVEGDDELVLRTLDVLAEARENRSILLRHLARTGLRAGAPVRVVVIAGGFPSRAVARLAPLSGREVVLLVAQRLCSALGETTHLVPALAPADPAPELHGGPERFLESLPGALGELGALALRRIDRVDRALDRAASADEVHWRYRGRRLCSLVRASGRLEGRLAPAGPARPLGPDGEVDAFLDEVLQRVLELAEEGPLDAGPAPLDGGPGEGSSVPETGPADPGLVLTAEELDAFRD